MSEYTAILYVGETLIRLLWDNMKDKHEVSSIIQSEDQITLSSPEEIGSGKKLSLFLYRIAENDYLKNQEMQTTGSTKLKNPPLTLSLFYLITPHTQSVDGDHLLLGKVMQIFHDNAILRGSALHESLAGEELRLVLDPASIDDLNKIWSVVSGSRPYKRSAFYEVTPVRIESARERGVRRVTERELGRYRIGVER